MSIRARIFALALLCLCTPQSVVAAPPGTNEPRAKRDAWDGKPMAVEGVTALASPVGALGITVDYGPLSWLAMNTGVGLGFAGSPQLGFTPRLRLVARDLGFGINIEGGISGGPYHSDGCTLDCSTFPTYSWRFAGWAHAGLGLEGRTWRWETDKNALQWRLFVGKASLLNPDDASCEAKSSTPCGAPPESATRLLYVGFAMGGAWDWD